MEQRNTQLFFESPELMTQCGLGETESLSSAGQTPLLHHALDQVQMPYFEIHNQKSKKWRLFSMNLLHKPVTGMQQAHTFNRMPGLLYAFASCIYDNTCPFCICG